MKEAQVKKLCLSLIKADTEEEVILLLTKAGFWDDPAVWRYYGDLEGNYSTIGAQQSLPEAALVEKLVNAVDARLMNECLARGVDPEGPHAPQTIRQGVARFFEKNPDSSRAGLIREWLPTKRTQVARGITIAATGPSPSKGNPSFVISDQGEGQTPEMMPNTLLSLAKTIKLRIPFVQGRFNMGGTGALRFCGRHNFQLVLSRRNPAFIGANPAHSSDSLWGFTVVRREDPTEGRRNSVYTFLAPVGAEEAPGKGGVLRFPAESMPIFPDGRKPYARSSQWGTLIKLYEYSATRFKSHILRKRGLLRRLDLLMPEVALPIRLHECRPGYRGHRGSSETTLAGIRVRLEDDRNENLEFSSSCPMRVAGEEMTATIYAFKKDRAETYRRNEGVIFTVDGQTQGHFTTDFFRRPKIGLSYLRDSILVVVDCSKFTGRAREDLFMNSRDRLRAVELRFQIAAALEELLKQHQGLRDLKDRRHRQDVQDKLEDSKPLEDVLRSLLKQSPTLSSLFLQGKRVRNPFKPIKAQSQDQPFEGKRHPSYFKFKGKRDGFELLRDCHINTRCRIEFETDVVNDYFSREIDAGRFSLFLVAGDQRLSATDYTLNLQDGIATLNLRLPPTCRVGDELRYVALVEDRTLAFPFENCFVLTIKGTRDVKEGGKGGRRKPTGRKPGDDQEIASGIELPRIIRVYENPTAEAKGWEDMRPAFDRYSALRVVHLERVEENGGNGRDIYDFYVNGDNVFLKAEQKAGGLKPEIAEARFVYGMVLLGLGLLHQHSREEKLQSKRDEVGLDAPTDQLNVADQVEEFSRAVAPVLLPMIDHLGALDLESTNAEATSGEAT